MSTQPSQYNALSEFVKVLIKYMEKFGLEAIDIAFLSFTNRTNIENLINLKGSLELPRMEAIAQSFGMHHYEFSNPNHEIPDYELLPERTRQRIGFRKKNGPYVPETRKSLTINEKITIALSFVSKGDEFLTEQIVEKINIVDADITSTTSSVGDRLSKSFLNYVENTNKPYTEKKGKGAKPFFYKLLSEIKKDELDAAIEIVGEYWFENYKKIIDQENENNKG